MLIDVQNENKKILSQILNVMESNTNNYIEIKKMNSLTFLRTIFNDAPGVAIKQCDMIYDKKR